MKLINSSHIYLHESKDFKLNVADMEIWKNNKEKEFPLAPMGVLADGSAHSRPSAQPPIDTRGIFSAQVSGRWG
jgi:hypothetical protein